MFAIRSTPTKGLGLFATKLIPRGTRILSERALINIHPPTTSSSSSSTRRSHEPERTGQESTAHQVLSAFYQLGKEDRRTVLGLSGWPGEGVGYLGRWWDVLRFTLFSPSSSSPSLSTSNQTPTSTPSLQKPSTTLLHRLHKNKSLLDIFRSNSFLLSPPSCPPSSFPSSPSPSPTLSPTISLFPQIARLNHSCIPNAQANLNPLTQRFNIHALSSINPGEEITISYLPETGLAGREERRGKLKDGYGFVCACPGCAEAVVRKGEGMEERRKMMRQRVAAFASSRQSDPGAPDSKKENDDMLGAGGYAPDGSTDMWDPPTPPSPTPSPQPQPQKEAQKERAANTKTEVKECESDTETEAEITLTTALIASLVASNISGHELASMYYRLANLYLSLSASSSLSEENSPRGLEAMENALQAAQQGLEIDRVCLGADHPVFEQVERWVGSLEGEVERCGGGVVGHGMIERG